MSRLPGPEVGRIHGGERGGVEFQSALAVVAAAFEEIDWPYVRSRLEAILEADPVLGEHMRRIDSRIRRRVRRALGDGSR